MSAPAFPAYRTTLLTDVVITDERGRVAFPPDETRRVVRAVTMMRDGERVVMVPLPDDVTLDDELVRDVLHEVILDRFALLAEGANADTRP